MCVGFIACGGFVGRLVGGLGRSDVLSALVSVAAGSGPRAALRLSEYRRDRDTCFCYFAFLFHCKH